MSAGDSLAAERAATDDPSPRTDRAAAENAVARTYSIAFVMELHVGHRTYYQNLRAVVDGIADVKPRWVEVTYAKANGILERLPLMPAKLIGALRGMRQVAEGLRGGHPYDVAFFHGINPAVFQHRLRRRLPFVLSMDVTPRQWDVLGQAYGHRADRPGSAISRFKHGRVRSLFHGARRLLAWTDWVRQSLIHDYGVDEQAITVLPLGVNTDLWRPAPAACRQDGLPRILFVGRDFVRKGGPALLEWFTARGSQKCELHAVTHTPLPAIPGLHVHRGLQPNSSELISLFQQSDLFVLPSFPECFGQVYLEAMATALPCIGCEVGGVGELIRPGRNGMLVAPGDTRQLGSAIETFLNDRDLAAEMGRRGRQLCIERFDSRRNGQRIVSLLKGAVQ